MARKGLFAKGGKKMRKRILPKEAKEWIDTKQDMVIVDVRRKEEYEEGHIPNAIVIPLNELETTIEKRIEDKDKTIVIYCRSGRRSEIAVDQLEKKGYTTIYDLGGILDWEYEIEKGGEKK